MSNHSGSYMLNDVLKVLERESVFEFLSKVKTQAIIHEITEIARYQADCNPGEILEGIGERLSICYCCQKSAEEFREGLCRSCFGEGFDSSDED